MGLPRALAVFVLLAAPAFAQLPSGEEGTPLLAVYGPAEYGAHGQNWDVAQDERGVLYFANTDGVLVFDGSRWSLLPMPNGSIVRSVACGGDGRIYVGAVGELGYLETAPDGSLAFRSLVGHLPEDQRDFGDVWRIFATEEGVLFWAGPREVLLRWEGGSFRSIDAETDRTPCLFGGRVWANVPGRGLSVVQGDALRLAPGGEQTADLSVAFILPHGDADALMGTRDGRLFVLPGLGGVADSRGDELPPVGRLRRLPTAVDSHLREHRIYGAEQTVGGDYVIGTMSGGAVVLDAEGRLRRSLDREQGLPDRSVWALFRDRDDGVWLGLNAGLVRVALPASVTHFPPRSGLEGTIEAIVRHRGRLHAATNVGVFVLDSGQFRRVPGVGAPCYSLLSLPDTLVAGCNQGVFSVDPTGAELRSDPLNVFALHRSRARPGRLYAGFQHGVRVLDVGARWTDRGDLPGIQREVRSIAEDEEGRLWMGTHFAGVIRVSPGETGDALSPAVELFTTDDGLPSLTSVRVYEADDGMLFATSGGLYRFDPRSRSFVPDEDGPPGVPVHRLAFGDEDRIWISRRSGRPVVVHRGGADRPPVLDEASTLQLVRSTDIQAVYADPEGPVWLGGGDGLFRVDPTRVTSPDRRFPTLVTEARARDGSRLGPLPARGPGPLELDFEQNALAFEFAAPTFDQPAATVFSHRLDGYERNWSSWDTARSKEYSYLPEGRYRFRVRSRNVYGTEGSEATFVFTIRPPWFRAPLAYLGYALLSGLLVAAIVRLRSRKLERERDRLRERQVALQREIDARRKVEEALRDSEEKLRLSQEGARMGTLTWDVSNDTVTLSPLAREILSLGSEDVAVGSGALAERIHAEDRKTVNERIRASLASGADVDLETRILLPGGETRWVHGRAAVHQNSSGRATSVNGAVLDVTARRVAEEERKYLIGELERRNAELERFTYTVSHDLRSPLVTVNGFLGLLERDLREGNRSGAEGSLGRIRRATGTMDRLLGELLDLSRVGRVVSPPEPVPLAELTREAARLIEAQMTDRGITLEIDSDLPVLHGDRARLLEVMQNLLENATKFMGGQGAPRIEVGWRRGTDPPVCFVRDNGIGIEAPHQDTVFGLFDRLDPDIEGTGVGLALVRRIVESHGGRIWVESEGRGRGSTFCFTLPRDPSDEDPREEASPATE